MSAIQPYTGHFAETAHGEEHQFALRVYFEDTDFSGVVYHARYLHFFERARSDMLARAGIGQREAFEAGQGAYAVTHMDIHFRKAAHFDDALLVKSTVIKVRGASVDIHQRLIRGGEQGEELICEADVTAAFVKPNGMPGRQPKEWVEAFAELITDRKDD